MFSVLRWLVWPWPWHSAQASLIVWPWPWQVGQARSTAKKPFDVRTRPWPAQVEQVCGLVPGLAPVPWQASQVRVVGMVISTSAPL